MKTAQILVNFGGPRNLEEIPSFLKALLTDRDVIRTRLPKGIHDWLFSRTAKKRAKAVTKDYALIGGKSPIFEDTESVAKEVGQNLLTFHRYLLATHPSFLEAVHRLDCEEIRVFPLFPQFSYATTGSIARWFSEHLDRRVANQLRWIKSYPAHPAYVKCSQQVIREYLEQEQIKEEEVVLLFSAHGLPQTFISSGDMYESECKLSFERISSGFPSALSRLSYQSRFGPEEWLKPYTEQVCEEILSWSQGRQNVVVVPLSFTSDHIETLFEIEHLYLPILKKKGGKGLSLPRLKPPRGLDCSDRRDL